MLEYSLLIPVLPLLAVIALQLFGQRLGKRAGSVAIAAMSISFLLSAAVLAQAALYDAGNGALFDLRFRWLTVHDTDIVLGVSVDNLTAVMLVIVSLVALLIEVYSLGYMHDDPRFGRYYRYMSLFGFSMLGLVMSDNLLQFFIFWELVGLCSYLLIGFWFEKSGPQYAQKKAFLVTKFADLGLLVGVLTVFLVFGTFHFETIFLALPQVVPATVTLIALLVFLGAMGKSAQFPFHIWLPNAMEGPTPVSALIHAATMVAAGVYLVARMYPLFALSSLALLVVAVTGTITLLIGATVALTSFDIKKILAYSTISQLGYMMLGLGAGSLAAGMFHLMTHAFFKALLFLCAGSVLHAAGTQDIRELSGLRKHLPVTFWTMLIASFALSGIPPFSGFWSKDGILLAAFNYNSVLFAAALLGAFFTGLYIFRLVFLCFFSREKEHSGHLHEAPSSMAWPMITLAGLSLVVGFFGRGFGGFVGAGAGHAQSTVITVPSVAIAAFGIGIAYLAYFRKSFSAERVSGVFWPVYRLVKNKYYIDEIVGAVFVSSSLLLSASLSWFDENVVDSLVDLAAGLGRAVSRLAGLFDEHVIDGAVDAVALAAKIITWLSDVFDRYVVDGIVNLSAKMTHLISIVSGIFDLYVVDGLVDMIGWLTQGFGKALRATQTGQVQTYVAMIFVGIVLTFLFIFSMVM